MKPSTIQKEFLFGDLTFKIRKVLFDVHNELGMYGREKQYADLAETKFKEFGFNTKREVRVGDTGNIVDFIIDDKVVLEFKAKPFLMADDYNQIQRYLHILNFRLGLLINFRTKYLSPKRVLNSSNL
ncbi:MAG: GxxExxY protein [Candidatus Doudnabacteria bacterium]|nr:GxxExxY protein [Candidatus Doudnabacteria bacterium]